MTNRDAVNPARERLLEEKASFVTKHRRRLVREADAATKEAQARYVALVDELAQVRQETFESRCVALWAALHGRDEAMTQPPALLVGGLLKPLQESLPGYAAQVSADAVFRLLRRDAEWLGEAKTRAQHVALLGGVDPRSDPEQGGAVWVATAEGQEAARRERQEALERYKAEWGHYPA